MKRLLVAVVCAVVLGGWATASCPFTVKCPSDGMDAYFVGYVYEWKCMCKYQHYYAGKLHVVVASCE